MHAGSIPATSTMTPLDLMIKEWMRQFLAERMAKEKANTANMATGFLIREKELEPFLDEMWVFINKKAMEHGAQKE